ncbi:MAG TPA: hypothetical protein VIL04_12285 [Solirubrobacterales bacterium]
MSPSNEPRWGFIAAISLIAGLIAAVVLFLALPDQRWIAGLIAAIAIVDAFVFGAILPNSIGKRAAAMTIEELNAQAEAADLADDEEIEFASADDEEGAEASEASP